MNILLASENALESRHKITPPMKILWEIISRDVCLSIIFVLEEIAAKSILAIKEIP